MRYDKERQEHNEQDWPSDERIDIIATNGNNGEHYDLTVDTSEGEE